MTQPDSIKLIKAHNGYVLNTLCWPDGNVYYMVKSFPLMFSTRIENARRWNDTQKEEKEYLLPFVYLKSL